ncbi:hypothetical protein K9N68_34280 (plasmid) [Kovacikia minuta CCNUW1]|uniref:hypothetical protein n=1 Tax=Kovacikia minuta TaxID=2931930 RepID=UPI001CCF679F|nr:hypothetical protein [Kovacikia minuta]UBF30285.1 hypothetical protein K9N68_34280 [Kovacikia minuta CCNUW1]
MPLTGRFDLHIHPLVAPTPAIATDITPQQMAFVHKHHPHLSTGNLGAPLEQELHNCRYIPAARDAARGLRHAKGINGDIVILADPEGVPSCIA